MKSKEPPYDWVGHVQETWVECNRPSFLAISRYASGISRVTISRYLTGKIKKGRPLNAAKIDCAIWTWHSVVNESQLPPAN
jgi:uncharacterized membrane protein YjdF